MSQHLISKKIWISMGVLAVMFCALTYAWFYYMNQWAMQSERMEIAQENSSIVQQAPKVAETAGQMVEPVEQKDPVRSFPCTLQLKDGTLGLYDEQGRLCQEMRQIGEYLSDQDRIQLIQGISVEDEEQLILLCESYHLQ